MPDPDSLGPSPTTEPVTTSGVDVDLQTLGLAAGGASGGPCRQIKLLSTAAGNLVYTQASPRDPANPDKSYDITNLPAGDVLNIQATKIKSTTVSGLKLMILFCLAVLLAGCATVRDGAVVSLNGAAEFGADAEKALAELDKGDQEDVLARSSGEQARAGLVAVRARYHPAWAAYRGYRAAWLSAAATLRAYDDAKRAGLPVLEADIAKAIADVVAAETALAKATAALRHPPPSPGGAS